MKVNAASLTFANAAGVAFDQLAAEYDEKFTHSLIGRAQRNAVWRVLRKTFKANENILELNCGTGEDAVFLARQAISVFACDASQQMISLAEQKLRREPNLLPIVFCHLPTESISSLRPESQFDGVFSNFSGLNCTRDLGVVARSLSSLVTESGQLLLCFSTRLCITEVLHYFFRGQFQKALRRCRGRAEATLGGAKLPIYYPAVGEISQCFLPYFKIKSITGIGIAVPPSYCEDWAQRHLRTFQFLCFLEKRLASIPIFRVTGDHILICFERVSQ